jgi:DNA-3-methyladenine glycosylase
MYSCLNVVTEPEGTAGAVLFRALMPLWVPSSWQGNTRGPGRLTRALGLDYRQHDGLPFTQAAGPFFLAAGPAVPDAAVEAGPRIGIRHATDRPWRFYIRDNPWVSAAK